MEENLERTFKLMFVGSGDEVRNLSPYLLSLEHFIMQDPCDRVRAGTM